MSYKRQIVLDASDDDEAVLTDVTTTTKQPEVVAVPSKKQLTLSEQEDLEEARLTADEKEAAEREAALNAPKFAAPSSLYTDVYTNNDANNNPSSSLSSDENGTEEDPLNRSPEKEIDLAQKRDLLQNSRLNEMFADEDADNAARQAKIKQLMEEDDRQWKEERKQRLLGKYAGVESWEEVEKMLGDDREKEAKETEMKVTIAQQAGVTLTMLEPTDTETLNNEDDEAEKDKDKPTPFKPGIVAGKKSSWFAAEDDIDLESEFQALPSKKSLEEADAADGGEAQASSSATVETTAEGSTRFEGKSDNLMREDGPRFVNGKLTSREQLMGISVGSAGGWSLEVFPGDFVVHRKYGIGRYEKTVLNPKSKLTQEEKDAAEFRRKEIINELMQERMMEVEEIQRIVEKFGTSEDKDPISNPLSTLLEISYSDAVVHVPIDRAYRLSRYRAGDAAIKPRLSRVKGEAWSKADRKSVV